MTEADLYFTALMVALGVVVVLTVVVMGLGHENAQLSRRGRRYQQMYRQIRRELREVRAQLRHVVADMPTPPRAYDVASLPTPVDPWADVEDAEAAVLTRAMSPTAKSLLTLLKNRSAR